MGSKLGGASALALAALAVAATGCGTDTVDNKKAESQVKSQLAAAGGQVKSVSCPSDVEAKSGKKFDCEVTTANGAKVTLHGTVVNDKGRIHFGSSDVTQAPTGSGGQTSP
jgi:hypothetical protein